MLRNVCLKFDEWELINEELSDQEYHAFQLSQKQVNEWKKYIQISPRYDYHKFERVGIYPEVKQVKSAKALNILCREGWRYQDMIYVMMHSYDFIGFILTHFKDADYNTSFEQWEDARIKMKDIIDKSNQKTWFAHDLVQLYLDVK